MTPTDLRNLPSQVLERLDGVDLRQGGIEVVQRGNLLEARVQSVEVRANSDGTVGLHGYASVYDYPYDVAGGPPYGWAETMVSGACAKSVAEKADVRCLVNHDGIPVARTKSMTMTLESDKTGLLVDVASLDLDSPLVQTLRSAMERGDLDEMSVAFRVIRQEWNDDYTERFIKEVKLYDVSIVTYPANPATFVQLNSDGPPADEPKFSLAYARAATDLLRSRAV